MAHGGTQKYDTRHNGIVGLNISLGHMAHPQACLQDGENWN